MILVKTNLVTMLGAGAFTLAPFIFILPELADDKALVEHEMVHYREQARWLVLPWLLAYLASPKFRLRAELRAYRRQIDLGGITLQRAAAFLTTLYRLKISTSDAVSMLQSQPSTIPTNAAAT